MIAGPSPARRVLIVEDEMLIALMLQDMLEDSGHVVEGIANSLSAGLDLARTAEIHLGILDINLNGEASFPIADMLRSRGIPFIFSTGYGSGRVPSSYVTVPQLVKPYQSDLLGAAIRAVFA
jgi:DNA-binding response OmpR family regulator